MKFFLFFIVPIIAIIVEIYFFRAYKSVVFELNKKLRFSLQILYFFVLTITLIAYLFTIYNLSRLHPTALGSYIFGIFFVLLISKIFGSLFIFIDDLVSFFQFIYSKIFSNSDFVFGRRKFLKKAALFTASLSAISFFYGMIKTAFDISKKRIDLKIKNLPSNLQGLKIVQLSDLHLGSFLNTKPVAKIVSMVNELNPDIVFFTGDLVNNISEEALPHILELKKVKAKYGVFSILGNHDYGIYYYGNEDTKGRLHNMKLMEKIHKELGWRLLKNEHEILNINQSELAIIGVENWGYSDRFPKLGDIEISKKGIKKDTIKLLMSHDPSHFEKIILNNYSDIAVTFSGHTHGMQFGIEVPGFIKWSPVQYIYKYWAGLYEFRNQQIYVNRGVGFIGYPGRLGIRPEITFFTLKES